MSTHYSLLILLLKKLIEYVYTRKLNVYSEISSNIDRNDDVKETIMWMKKFRLRNCAGQGEDNSTGLKIVGKNGK